ncbi:hypothetical protein Nepgr_014001 [Nepenthes gracilis]|uniref:DYW domain-containing protein n=1 Tax=Nepenthes gracilis TaxID=150966 RepID=A0AAD3SJV5_NEPGR|nr:hypothetical protein Nepgr_014001 [Nepenthes gracilis]
MVPITATVRWPLSNFLFNHSQRKLAVNFHQYYCSVNVRRFSSASLSNAAISQLSIEVDYPQEVLDHSRKRHAIRPNYQTYLCLLQGYSSSGSVMDVKKLHGLILKLGFNVEHELCGRLVEYFVANGQFHDASKLFDEMLDGDSRVSLFVFNSVIAGFAAKKLPCKALELFSRMPDVDAAPDEYTFANVVKACSKGGADGVGVPCIEQIHAKIVRYGFGISPLVCNPLIDLYSKNGLAKSAMRVFEELCSRDSVSWVAIISGLSQNGHEEQSILLFCDEMHMSGLIPTPYVLSSVLSSCSKVEWFELGEELHALVFKWGFASEIFVCNALVTLYSRWGNLTSAEQIFRKMLCKDGVSYNSLISGLAQHGFSDRALQLFKKMQHNFIKPDCVTVASLVSACATSGALDNGRQLHSYALKAGFCSDMIIEGSLLDLYVKCSDIETAHKYFLTSRKENVVLWNVILVAYGQMGNLSESCRIFSEMQIEGLEPNQYTYPSILRTCTSVGAVDVGEQIHTQIVKTGFQFNVYVCSVLIDMYAKHGQLDAAWKIFVRLTEDDLVSWTAMIAGYAQHDNLKALKLFEEMQNRGIQSDNIGFSNAISACAGIQALDQGRQIHAQACVFGYSEDLSIGNALTSLYARCGKVQDAFLAFKKIDAKDSISWNALISGLSQSGNSEEALRVFTQMNQVGIEANLFTYGSAISAAANTANIKQGKLIHAKLFKTGYNFETEASNALITMYAKCGSIDDAGREFHEMAERNEITWNAMITGYSQHGFGKEALELFEEMKRLGLKPNHVTFVGVLSACSHVGLVEDGLCYFESMGKEHDLMPQPEHYVCMVDILGRAGYLYRARKFIDEMEIEPDAMVWRTLLSACTVHKNIEIGEVAASRLLELEPEDSATYVLISNMYTVDRRWDFRDRAWKSMKDRGVKKEPGRSWIEVESSIHSFFAGDRLHPLAEKIYDLLEDLNRRAAKMGYVTEQHSLLNETEQKDLITQVHSERLAIAFGLLSLSSAIPLRVIKNLRVCNDCHSWIKYVSKISKRAIIVRDAYRFHHFEDGSCSCRDYW